MPSSPMEPATTMSNVASSSSWNVGLTVHSPLIRPRRTAADRAVERQTGETHRTSGRVHGGDVVRVGQSTDRTVTTTWTSSRYPSLKVGPQRAVDQAGREDRRLARPAFAPEERAGDLAGRVHPLLDVDREREEVDPLAGVRS